MENDATLREWKKKGGKKREEIRGLSRFGPEEYGEEVIASVGRRGEAGVEKPPPAF